MIKFIKRLSVLPLILVLLTLGLLCWCICGTDVHIDDYKLGRFLSNTVDNLFDWSEV